MSSEEQESPLKRKRGVAPKGNKYALGHKGGGAPKGNKFALGSKGGGHVKYHTDEELLILGEELLIWLEENKKNKDVVHMSQFYSQLKQIPRSQWWLIRQRKVFQKYYESSMDFMAYKVMTNDKLPTAYGSRYLSLYCGELRSHEKSILEEKADIEAAAKAKEVSNITEEELRHNKAIIDGIIALQKNSGSSK